MKDHRNPATYYQGDDPEEGMRMYQSILLTRRKHGMKDLPRKADFGLPSLPGDPCYREPGAEGEWEPDPEPDMEVVAAMKAGMAKTPTEDLAPLTKPQWVAFYPDAWLAGTSGLSAVEMAAYIFVCSQLMGKGRLTRKEFMFRFRMDPGGQEAMQEALDNLIEMEKVVEIEGRLMNAKAEEEYQIACGRIEQRRRASRSRWDKPRSR